MKYGKQRSDLRPKQGNNHYSYYVLKHNYLEGIYGNLFCKWQMKLVPAGACTPGDHK